MERAEVLQVMRDKAVELLDVDPETLQENVSFVVDLEIDSLSLVEYVMDLEDALGIELAEEALGDLSTIGAFLDVIMTKVAS